MSAAGLMMQTPFKKSFTNQSTFFWVLEEKIVGFLADHQWKSEARLWPSHPPALFPTTLPVSTTMIVLFPQGLEFPIAPVILSASASQDARTGQDTQPAARLCPIYTYRYAQTRHFDPL